MNKTVSINLGGLFFHIDEDAYQRLNRYFDAIKSSLSPDGKDEIMSDIEGRIAELLSEKMKNDKQVVGSREVDEVIAIMGQPEDYRIDEDNTKQASQSYYTPGYDTTRTKKFYRDEEKGMIAGVCAGVGHYFRIDPLWVRIIFIISLFPLFGTTILIYILLWVLIPKAITTTEKLEMTGEPINISNIEKKVREEISNISERLQNVDYDKLGASARSGAERVSNTMGSAFGKFFGAIAKVIGAVITVIAAVGLGSMLIGFLALCFSSAVPEWHPYFGMVNYTDTPIWLVGLLGFIAAGIPVFFLFLLGLKILISNLRTIGSITKYTLLAVWIIAVAMLVYFGIRQATEISSESKSGIKQQIELAATDTLYVKLRHDDNFSKSVEQHSEFWYTQDAAHNNVIYSNNVYFHILTTDQEKPYVQIEKHANGSSLSNARERAEKIKYNFEIQGNKLILDNYLLSDVASKFRNQKVEIYLYLPEGTFFKPDMSVSHYNYSDHSIFDMNADSDEYVYKMGKHNAVCLNCPPEPVDNPEEWDDSVNDRYRGGSTSVEINDEGIKVDVHTEGDSIIPAVPAPAAPKPAN